MKSTNGKSNFKSKQNVECWNYGKTSHIKKQCRALKKNEENKGDVANTVIEGIHDMLLLSVNSPINSCVLDLGTSFHITTHREIIENYVSRNYGKLYVKYGKPLDIMGVGDICLKMSNDSMWKIHKVRYILKLMQNLILVAQLNDERHNVTFTGGV